MRSDEELGELADLGHILEILQDMDTAPTWLQARDVLEQHPEMLTEEVGGMLEQLSAAMSENGDEHSARGLRRWRDLLSRCRELGIGPVWDQAKEEEDQALDALASLVDRFLGSDTWEESRRILEQHPELMDTAAIEFLAQATQKYQEMGAGAYGRSVAEHLTVLRSCAQSGIEVGFALHKGNKGNVSAALERLVMAFVNATSFEEKRHLLEQHLELLGEPVVALLDDGEHVRVALGDYQGAQLLADHTRLLRRCRDVGIDRAFTEEVAKRTGLSPDQQRLLLEIISHAKDEVDMMRRLSSHPELEAAIQDIAIATSPPPPPIIQLFDTIIRAETWREAGHIVDEHPELLSDEADRVFGQLIERTRALGREKSARTYTDYCRFLRRCRESGIVQAITEQAYALAGGAATLLERYQAEGQKADLDQAIELWQAALEECPSSIPLQITILHDLGNSLIARYALAGVLSDLRNGIQFCEQALQQGRADLDESTLAIYLNGLATGLISRYDAVGELDDLQRAISLYAEAMDRAVPPSAMTTVLNNSADALLKRYHRLGQLTDLEQAIGNWQRLVEETPRSSPHFSSGLRNRGTGLMIRYEVRGEIEDLNQAIQDFLTAEELEHPQAPGRPGRLNNLGVALAYRYERTRNPSDLNEAIKALEEAVERTLPGSPDLSSRLDNLGRALYTRYNTLGIAADLGRCIELHETALRGVPPHAPSRARILSNLGIALLSRPDDGERLADLDEGIELLEQAVRHTAANPAQRSAYMTKLGDGLMMRYMRRATPSDLELAVCAFREAMKGDCSTWLLPTMLAKLGRALVHLSEYTGSLTEFEEAIDVLDRATEQLSADSGLLSETWDLLGTALFNHYERTDWDFTYLERAVDASERAVRLSATNPAVSPGFLANLGYVLRVRHEQTGVLADLERAITVLQRARETTADETVDRPMILNALGSALIRRYELLGEPEDSDAAVEFLSESVNRTPTSSLNWPGRVNNYGSALRTRYQRTFDIADLHEIVAVLRRGDECTTDNVLGRLDCRGNLANALLLLHLRTGSRAELEEAIQINEEIVAQTPSSSPRLPVYLTELGDKYSAKYQETRSSADLRAALDAWERALSEVQAVSFAAPVLYSVGQQQRWSTLYTHLVTAYLELAHNEPTSTPGAHRRSLEIAEAHKSRLLTELVSRSDQPLPPGISSEQASREKDLLAKLTLLDTAELKSLDTLGGRPREAEQAKHHRSREQYRNDLEQLWEEMAQAGLEAADYVSLRRGGSCTWNAVAELLAGLDEDAAILSLFIGIDHTVLFILRAGWEAPAIVETDLTPDGWADLWRRLYRELHRHDGTGRRGETWDLPLRPLLTQAAAHLAGISRLVISPYGVGHLLPWAVLLERWAGCQGHDGNPLPVVTVPALGLLMRFRLRPAPCGDVLVVGNPKPIPGFEVELASLKADQANLRPVQDLPHAELEARMVAALFSTAPLIGARATQEAVLLRLSSASLIHIAAHASFTLDSPLDSGILLADGVLTGRTILAHHLQADLVVLSACETAMSRTLGGDELAGLAIAFLYAGAQSLLVSLWAVDDPATAALMAAFYDARVAGADKGQALSLASAYIRKQEKWAHPYYWGAFILIGKWT